MQDQPITNCQKHQLNYIGEDPQKAIWNFELATKFGKLQAGFSGSHQGESKILLEVRADQGNFQACDPRSEYFFFFFF